jgi:hypothetical protein
MATANTIPFPPPMKMSGTLSTEWKRFRGQWENYVVAINLSDDSARRAAVFLACVGTEAYEVFQTFEFDEEAHRKDIQKVIDAFDKYCVGEINVTYERYMFNRRDQDTAESLDTFLNDIRRLIRTCEYGELGNSILRDRIVMGIRDDATRRKLLQTRKLDLKQAIDICKANEAATHQLKTISQPEDVHAANSYRLKDQQRRRKSSPSSRDPRNVSSSPQWDRHREVTPEHSCNHCGRRHGNGKTTCPAYGKYCKSCNKRNHFASVCRAATKSVDELEDGNSQILAINNTQSSRIYSKLQVGNKVIRFLLDCGATVNLIPVTLLQQLGNNIPKVRPPESILRMFDGKTLNTEGMITMPVTHLLSGRTEYLDFYISSTHNQALLGVEACLQFELISVNHDNICSLQALSVCRPLGFEYIASKYSDLFEGYGKMAGTVHLDADPAVPPVRMPLRKLPIAIKEKVENELRNLQREEIIAPVTEPTDWISALLVVNKSSGGVRLCIDPKPLNKALRRDHYPMPTIEDILPELAKAKVFSTVDAKSAFWHLELDEESSKMTTFETPFGKFRWLRLPYGVSPHQKYFSEKSTKHSVASNTQHA